MSKNLLFQYDLIVCLDVLGQRESLRKIQILPSKENEEGDFIKLVKESLGKIDLIRGIFQSYFSTLNSPTPNRNDHIGGKSNLLSPKKWFFHLREPIPTGAPATFPWVLLHSLSNISCICTDVPLLYDDVSVRMQNKDADRPH